MPPEGTEKPREWTRLGRAALTLLLLGLGGCVGGLASWLGVPLAWMVGPFVCVGAATILFGLPQIPVVFRHLGQIIAGGAIGLYLTPAAMDRVFDNLLPIVLAASMVSLASLGIGLLQMRLGRLDAATAIFSSVPGGPLDMAVLAAQRGGDPMRTAVAQTARIALVVLFFPPLLTLSSNITVMPTPATGAWLDTAILIVVGIAAGYVFRFLRIINPFFLGPLIVVSTISALDGGVAPHHAGVVPFAQVLLGVSLGGMFQRSMFRNGLGFLGSTLVTTALLLAVCAVVAEVLTLTTGYDFATMMLANAPGAVTEMVITAKVLQLDVPMVASYQIIRIVICLLMVGFVFRFVGGPKGDDAGR